MLPNILIADDNAELLTVFVSALNKGNEFRVDPATTPEECISLIQSRNYNMVVVDIQFTPDGMEGLDLIPKIRALLPKACIIAVSSFTTPDVMNNCLDLGANNYITKHKRLPNDIVQRIRESYCIQRSEQYTESRAIEFALKNGVAISSPIMIEVYKRILQVKESPKDVGALIIGESGTGKERAARSTSCTESEPFEAVDCGAIEPNLIIKELFGAEKGSFTGAATQTKGAFERANGGTIFLDEIQNLSMNAQQALLRVLQERSINRLGGTKPIELDLRIVAATNADLDALVKEKKFRPDLKARLEQVVICLPPLRERVEDIELIVKFLLKKHFPSKDVTVDDEVLWAFQRYSWPLNIRELENEIIRIKSKYCRERIMFSHLSESIRKGTPNSSIGKTEHNETGLEYIGPINPDDSFDTIKKNLVDYMYEIRKNRLSSQPNKTELAKLLGISPRSISSWVDKRIERGDKLPTWMTL